MKTLKEMLTPAYELMYEEELKDSKSMGAVLRHKKSGARVCVLSNDDDNKVFSVGFRTPPKDSTGVAHILEHSVLCGSEKFPLKDPFVELMKGSLNTFLNAMTYPDHTLYPVASCNDQDFKNLMDVYMDAVFHPNIYRREEIFRQEGWHYEVAEDGELSINGVVYNEMKGAFSSPEQVLWRLILNSLYPDNAYGVCSGGNPEAIPDLTYENFLAFHGRYYHPSNSYIYLYGDMDVKERLTWLDEAYLSAYDTIEVDSDIAEQKPFGGVREVTGSYPIAEGDDPAGKAYLSYNMTVGSCNDTKLCTAMQLLNTVLLSPVGPLYQALVRAGISPNIMSSFDDGIKQPFLSIIAQNTDPEKKDEFLRVIRDTLQKIAEEGVPERSLRAAINSAEFRYREADYGSLPKGLMLNMMSMCSWLFNENGAFEYLRGNDLYAELKKEIGTGYYEELIRKYMLEPEHATVFTLLPEAGLVGRREKELKEQLAGIRAGMTDEQLDGVREKQAALKKYQDTPDTKEDVERLPMLKRSDLKKEARPIIAQPDSAHGLNIVSQETFTNGIAYAALRFDVHGVPKEKVPYLGLLSTVLGYMDTENYTYRELDNETNIETGGISTSLESLMKDDDAAYYRPVFKFEIRTMYDKLEKAFELVNEQVWRTKLGDIARLKEIVMELRARKQMELNSASHVAARRRALSYQYEKSCFEDMTQGIGYYRFIRELAEKFDEKAEEISSSLKELCGIIFNRSNLTVSLTAEATGLERAKSALAVIAGELPGESAGGDFRFREAQFGFVPERKQEAFTCPGQVQYVAKCGNYLATGEKITGVLDVMNKALSINYFWDKVRVHGGAYGCMSGFGSLNGTYTAVSYRDPNLAETIDVFDHAWEYLRDFDADEREMTKLIIGTLGDTDTPLTPQMVGERSFSLYMAGVPFETLQKRRDERLAACPEDIRAYAPMYKKLMEQDCLCVVGSETKVAENKELFKTVEALY
ncbi:MAG: insulinase family protein [Lachnospiraceae bacterium]|nr:insulinase family protein [Lachnospiraceae bacterium]